MKINSKHIRKLFAGLLTLTAWVCLAWLLIAAVDFQKEKSLNELKVVILNPDNRIHLLEKNALSEQIHEWMEDSVHHYTINDFPVKELSEFIKAHSYINSARVFISKSGILRIECVPNYPVARVVPGRSPSYLIDSDGVVMPVSDQISLRLPVVRGRVPAFDTEREEELLRLREVGSLAEKINKSEFLSVLTDQILITALGDYVIIPSLGSEKIELGSSDRILEKLRDTEDFYYELMAQIGWNIYEKISLKYKGQVVATRIDPSSP